MEKVAPFPGSCAWAEKKEPGTQFVLRYTNLHEAHPLFPHKRCLPLTTLSADNDKGATNVLSPSLAGIVYMFVHSS